MDPLVEAFQRINPTDHSLDGLPVTVVVVTFGIVLATTLVLRFAGRSWRAWHLPALSMVVAWWAGLNVGHSGFRSGQGVLSTLVLVLLLITTAPRALRAALVRAPPDGRG
jgi:hypothetical protein